MQGYKFMVDLLILPLDNYDLIFGNLVVVWIGRHNVELLTTTDAILFGILGGST